jgi:hypothetical protein
MTIHIENATGGGSSFPPAGTQLAAFEDNFNRPDAGTLGQRWGMLWAIADQTVDSQFPGPFPQRCAANPRIENGQVVWFNRSDVPLSGVSYNLGRGWSVAWPQQLAWMTQGQFDQYVECDLDYSVPYDSSLILCSVFSPNVGSLDPDIFGVTPVPFQGEYGFYGFYISENSLGQIGGSLNYSTWGGFPAAIPDGVRGHAGINTIGLQFTETISNDFATSYPARFRLETRRINNRWQFQAFSNGQLMQTGYDDRLLSGSPAMSCNIYWNTSTGSPDPNRLLVCDNFNAGWLR